MSNGNLVPYMTRTHFCPRCESLGYPRKKTLYVVFGQSHHSLNAKLHVSSVPRGFIGLTPHVFMRDYQYIPTSNKDGGLYTISGLCGVLGCGFTTTPDLDEFILNRNPDVFRFSLKDFKSLRKFKDPMYHLEDSNMNDWEIEKILEEQLAIFG